MRTESARVQQLEVAVLRGRMVSGAGFADKARQAEIQHHHDTHQHPLLQRLNEVLSPTDVLDVLARIDPFPTIAGPAGPVAPVSPLGPADPGTGSAG